MNKLILGLIVSCLLCIVYAAAEDRDYAQRCSAMGGVPTQDVDHHNVCLKLPKHGLMV